MHHFYYVNYDDVDYDDEMWLAICLSPNEFASSNAWFLNLFVGMEPLKHLECVH